MRVARWRAVATYRSERGTVEVVHDVEELDEFLDLLEAGPDWNCLIDIRITLARPDYAGATIEECDKIGRMKGGEVDAYLATRPVRGPDLS